MTISALSYDYNVPGLPADDMRSDCDEWLRNLWVNAELGDGGCIVRAGRAIGADWVLFGTAWWNGSDITVEAQLVPVQDPAKHRTVSFVYSKPDRKTLLHNAWKELTALED